MQRASAALRTNVAASPFGPAAPLERPRPPIEPCTAPVGSKRKPFLDRRRTAGLMPLKRPVRAPTHAVARCLLCGEWVGWCRWRDAHGQRRRAAYCQHRAARTASPPTLAATRNAPRRPRPGRGGCTLVRQKKFQARACQVDAHRVSAQLGCPWTASCKPSSIRLFHCCRKYICSMRATPMCVRPTRPLLE